LNVKLQTKSISTKTNSIESISDEDWKFTFFNFLPDFFA
jgi:hypothetical protein